MERASDLRDGSSNWGHFMSPDTLLLWEKLSFSYNNLVDWAASVAKIDLLVVCLSNMWPICLKGSDWVLYSALSDQIQHSQMFRTSRIFWFIWKEQSTLISAIIHKSKKKKK